MHETENKEKRNLFTDTSSANEGMIVNNKPAFEEWFIEDKFAIENVMVLDDSKAQALTSYLKKLIWFQEWKYCLNHLLVLFQTLDRH